MTKTIARTVCLLSFLCFTVSSKAQTPFNSFLSKPTELPLTGWNKTLLLRDGRTVLFHLETGKATTMIVFDKNHNEVLNKKIWFTMVEEPQLEHAYFKGLYDIAGFPVLFISQPREDKNTLFRIKISPDDGKILDEQMVRQSPSYADPEYYFVSKAPGSDNYAIFYCHGTPVNGTSTMKASFWNAEHKKIKSVTLQVPYDKNLLYTYFLGFDYDQKGNANVALGSAKDVDGIKKFHLLYGSAANDDTVFKTVEMPISIYLKPVSAFFQHCPASDKINMLLSCEAVKATDAISKTYYVIGHSMLLVLNQKTLEINSIKEIKNRLVSENIKQYDDSNHFFNGFPIRFYTTSTGKSFLLSEIISTAYWNGAKVVQTLFGPICATKVDADAEEESGIIYPKSQYVLGIVDQTGVAVRNFNRSFYGIIQPHAIYRQYPSFNFLPVSSGYFLFYNDNIANFKGNTEKHFASIDNFDASEAIAALTDEHGSIKKYCLFGEPAADESHALMVESGNTNDAGTGFSALVSVRKGDKVQLCMGWCDLKQ